MTGDSKITLSAEELQLAGNTEWILTKRIIIEKVAILFGALSNQFKAHVLSFQKDLPEPIIQSSPKISKGENYLQLPYIMLDYPRSFESGQFFAIRTMFWWGNFISITLHVSGRHATKLHQALQNEKVLKSISGFYLCINEEEWEHHFEKSNYQLLHTLSKTEIRNIISKEQFVKLAVKFELQQWNEMPELLEKAFIKLLQLSID